MYIFVILVLSTAAVWFYILRFLFLVDLDQQYSEVGFLKVSHYCIIDMLRYFLLDNSTDKIAFTLFHQPLKPMALE